MNHSNIAPHNHQYSKYQRISKISEKINSIQIFNELETKKNVTNVEHIENRMKGLEDKLKEFNILQQKRYNQGGC